MSIIYEEFYSIKCSIFSFFKLTDYDFITKNHKFVQFNAFLELLGIFSHLVTLKKLILYKTCLLISVLNKKISYKSPLLNMQ